VIIKVENQKKKKALVTSAAMVTARLLAPEKHFHMKPFSGSPGYLEYFSVVSTRKM
jgi:hypothetical protein